MITKLDKKDYEESIMYEKLSQDIAAYVPDDITAVYMEPDSVEKVKIPFEARFDKEEAEKLKKMKK